MVKYVLSFVFLLTVITVSLSQEVQILDGLNHPVGIVAHESDLYICEHGGEPGLGAISKIELDIENPTVTTLASGFSYSRSMCLIGDILYYANNNLHKINIADENPTSEQVTNAFSPRALIYHNDYLYLSGDDRIRRMNISSGVPTLTTFVNNIETRILAFALLNNELYYGYSNKISKIDLNNANAVPEEVISNLDSNVYSLTFYENKLLIGFALGYNIQTLDLTEESPVAEDFIFTTLGQPMNMQVINNDLYVAGGSGDRIFKIENLDQLLSANEFELSTSKKVYPNPANETISLIGITEPTKYKIINNDGRLVLNGILNIENKIRINKLAQGLYYLKLETKSAKNTVIKLLVN